VIEANFKEASPLIPAKKQDEPGQAQQIRFNKGKHNCVQPFAKGFQEPDKIYNS
jgi:hypothetical protein